MKLFSCVVYRLTGPKTSESPLIFICLSVCTLFPLFVAQL